MMTQGMRSFSSWDMRASSTSGVMTMAPSMGALSRLSIVKTEFLSSPLYTNRCRPRAAAVRRQETMRSA